MYGFIYITTNHINNKKYIGKKKYDRRNDWEKYLGSGIILKNAINKYGKENFSKEIIEECETLDDLNIREKYWINYYNAIKSDEFYNIASGGDGGDTTIGLTEEQKKKITENRSKAAKGKINLGNNNGQSKPVICLNTNEVFDTIEDAAKYANVTPAAISSCCKGRTQTSGGLQWEFYQQNNVYKLKEIKYKPNSVARKVYCYQTNEVFDSATDAGIKYNIAAEGIRECCNFSYSSYGKLENGIKLQWFWYDYYISDSFDINNHKIKLKPSEKLVPVIMCSLDGEPIKKFENQKEANDYLGNPKNGRSYILRCCRENNRTYMGHKWRYS